MQPPEDYEEKNIQGSIHELLNAGPDYENRRENGTEGGALLYKMRTTRRNEERVSEQ